MTAASGVTGSHRRPGLADQTVAVIGGSAGIGLETARQVRADGGQVILVGRDPEKLERAAHELEPSVRRRSTSPTPTASSSFFQDLPGRSTM